METTRHTTATIYIVNDGATALHWHRRLGIRIPPGGHVERDELPHEAGLREVREETGLDPT
ncbi:NUDIX domain-containing protein, partial [Stenotrophomonas maltophilia]|uniref:NUDIX domain-containing protein n=1 Tax=Stenotrophomonas maltophilia TaxID=40324 RepID=UPI0013DB0A4C